MECRAADAGGAMRYVGIDLAWGSRRRTGVAVLDSDGTLLALDDVHTDEEIVEWTRRWSGDACAVAIDAPIVVTNATGQREAERLVTRYFGRFNAGAHPSNTSREPFLDGHTRALELTRSLGLDIDPGSTASQRAIEVYPHPATVALFGLDKAFSYKHKPGRSLAHLRSELLRLMDALEGLANADVPLILAADTGWDRIRGQVESATQKSHLRAVEDVVDSVVCAYVARYSVERPEAVRVLGSVENGYILTPVTPALAAEIDGTSSPGQPASYQYGKLVRDNIPAIIEASGRRPVVRRLPPSERLPALHAKLREEVAELTAAQPEAVRDELADVLEVLRAIGGEQGLEWPDVEQAAADKAATRGRFESWWWLEADDS
jgi:predicted RNase H-like nuclease/predicted house-cleaning noncanonical NTP pyrophosphatase (MazG superfamily)